MSRFITSPRIVSVSSRIQSFSSTVLSQLVQTLMIPVFWDVTQCHWTRFPNALTDRNAFTFVVKRTKNIISKWILNKYDGKAWTALIWVRIGASDSREPSGCINGENFLNI
jgi:hypothetical protein